MLVCPTSITEYSYRTVGEINIVLVFYQKTSGGGEGRRTGLPTKQGFEMKQEKFRLPVLDSYFTTGRLPMKTHKRTSQT
jgi:hypothetical protein